MKKVLSILLTLVMLLSTLSVFSVLSVSAAPARGDGTGKLVDMPEGSGTKNDPYLISSLSNLNWLRDEIKDAQTNSTYGLNFNGVSATFDGVYFEQTADIDLNGGTFNSIGGYICDPLLWGNGDTNKHPGYTYMGAFGGHYNGNGYKIYNGTIAPAGGMNNKTNINWASGFIAVLYGGTVENLVFDDIDFQHSNLLNGNVVGVAHAPLSKEITVSERNSDGSIVENSEETIPHPDAAYVGDPSFNVIENVVVKDTCTSTLTATTKLMGEISHKNGYLVGGIVGRAISTTVRGCVNEADIKVPSGTAVVGGIVAIVGNSALIESCKFTGTITMAGTWTDVIDTWTTYVDVSVGGILGSIASKAYGMDADLSSNHTSVLVKNCYNAGDFKIAAGSTVQPTSGSIMWGGIMGGLNGPIYKNADDKTISYRFENCHNTTVMSASDVKAVAAGETAPTTNELRVGGILGSSWTANNGEGGTLYIKDCFSVDGERAKYNGTNEASIHGNTSTSGLKAVVVEGANAIKADGTAYAVGNNIDKTYATRALTDYIYETTDGTTYTLSTTVKFQDVINAIDATIAKISARGTDKVTAIGYQEALDGSSYRVVLGINSTRWYSIGAEISWTGNGTADKNSDTVYSGVEGMVGTEKKTWMASDLYVDSLAVLDLTDIAETGVSVYTIRTYVQDQDGDHTKVYGDVIVITFTDGAYTSAVVNPTE